jgi:uncharacterized SAM-binding protein YcdF (DUF218 family)
MAFGRQETAPMPDAEGEARCERAYRIAMRIGDQYDAVWIGLGGGMPYRYPEPFGEQTLADLSERCLVNKGWGWMQIIKRPEGCNTRTELFAVRKIERNRRAFGAQNVRLRLVTSWWHAPRVWLVALLVFHRPLHVSVARTTLTFGVLAREMLKEMLKVPCELLCVIPWVARRMQNVYDPQYHDAQYHHQSHLERTKKDGI